jgi:UDP-N-acetylglucosamine 2-epimerase (non-hydrolysing)
MKVLFVFGTRPEAIKLAPLIKGMQKTKNIEIKICITAQHREMLDQVLTFFEIEPDFDFDLMKPGQNLNEITSTIIIKLKEVFEVFCPDYVFVHGDTTTSFSAALAAFYNRIKICHVEAGLRTNDKFSPFPEEMNRVLTGRIADFHFAPTIGAKTNLINEGVKKDSILVTGNTVIDSLFYTLKKLENLEEPEIESLKKIVSLDKKIILVTGHRRENFGDGFLNICLAIKAIAEKFKDVEIIFPVHLNPNVQKPVYDLLNSQHNIKLIAPLSYVSFIWLLNKSYLVLTDSGGIQEEAPSLGKPVLVMRENTERPEAVEAGTVILVGTDKNKIIEVTTQLLNDSEFYSNMSALHNPYGDGNASKRIVDFLIKFNINENK